MIIVHIWEDVFRLHCSVSAAAAHVWSLVLGMRFILVEPQNGGLLQYLQAYKKS